MQDSKLTDEIKQMNAFWRLLAATVNEGLGILKNEQLSPEVRLKRMLEHLEFAGRFTRELPPSVFRELDADSRVQATLADIALRLKHTSDEGGADLVMDDDGTFHEVADKLEPGARWLSDAEIQTLLREDSEE